MCLLHFRDCVAQFEVNEFVDAGSGVVDMRKNHRMQLLLFNFTDVLNARTFSVLRTMWIAVRFNLVAPIFIFIMLVWVLGLLVKIVEL